MCVAYKYLVCKSADFLYHRTGHVFRILKDYKKKKIYKSLGILITCKSGCSHRHETYWIKRKKYFC